MHLATTANRLAPFGTTIFAEITALANERGAINLGQGFPDFDGPPEVMQAAKDAMDAGHNQYAPLPGIPELRTAIAERWERDTGEAIDPAAQVTVTSGCTEAVCAALLGLVNPGEEVVVFEPFYDSYPAAMAMAGAVPRYVTLRAPDFSFDEAELRAAFSDKTRAILLNTPHNPTGKVFTREELALIAELCIEHDAIAITDEVYDRIVFEGEHIALASLPGMAERTVSLNSLGKTYSLTGWKIGWAVASPDLSKGVRAAHQFLTFAVATPLQHAAAAALRLPDSYITNLQRDYKERRDLLCGALSGAGFALTPPGGSYFVMADHTPLGLAPDDVSFCKLLIEKAGIAAIPPSFFYSTQGKGEGSRLVRFAFCKRLETLNAAVERLSALGA
jgi:aspartate/methionine/tyrosine aminotransferase